MPAALKQEIRQAIVELHSQGTSFVEIAGELQISYEACRNIWNRWKKTGELSPNYAACSHSDIRKDQAVYEQAIALRKAHPRWGAPLIRLKLSEEFEEQQLPAVRTLQTWFRRAGVSRSPRVQEARVKVERGTRVHAVWAIDAKERMKLADGNSACWITVTDEASGAILYTEAFPPEELDNRICESSS